MTTDQTTPDDDARATLTTDPAASIRRARALLRSENLAAARTDVDDLLTRAVALRDSSRPGTFAKERGQRLVNRTLELRSLIGASGGADPEE